MYIIDKHIYRQYWYLFLLDTLMLITSVMITSLVIYGYYWIDTNKEFILLITLVNLLICFLYPFYTGFFGRGYLLELRSIVLQVLIVYGFSIIFLYMAKTSAEYSRRITGFSLFVSIFLFWIYRSLFKKLLSPIHAKNQPDRNVVIVADTCENASAIIEKLRSRIPCSYNVVGVCCLTQTENMPIQDIDNIEDQDALRDYLTAKIVDEMIISKRATDKIDLEIIRNIINMGIILHLEIDTYVNDLPNTRLSEEHDLAFLTSSFGVATRRQVLFKRLLDIAGGIVGTVFMCLACLIFGPIIYFQSPGSIFFVQQRVGKNGRLFKIYKFRTMYLDAEERKAELMKLNKIESDLMFKIEDDPRIIPIGHFLRKTSIDELPQFINVLMGQMSLVGTRPPTVDEFRKYEPHHKLRLSIKPGITGNWQVSGRSEITDFEEVVSLDADYIDNWTLSKDIKILFKTIILLFKGGGAY